MLGNKQYVNRRLWANVVKRKHQLILIDLFARDFSRTILQKTQLSIYYSFFAQTSVRRAFTDFRKSHRYNFPSDSFSVKRTRIYSGYNPPTNHCSEFPSVQEISFQDDPAIYLRLDAVPIASITVLALFFRSCTLPRHSGGRVPAGNKEKHVCRENPARRTVSRDTANSSSVSPETKRLHQLSVRPPEIPDECAPIL